MARRWSLLLAAVLLIALTAAPAYRWLSGHLLDPLPVYSRLFEFSLVDASGHRFEREDMERKVWVVDFIYTRCEDTCPLQTAEMRRLQQEFSGAPDFRQLSITTDPAHDTGAVLAKYARKYGADTSRWHFVSGKEKEIRNLVLKGFRLSYATQKAARPAGALGARIARLLLPSAHAHHPGHPEEAGTPEVLISHSSRFVLIDRKFQIRGYYHSNDADSLAKLRKHLRRVLGG